MSSWLKKVGSFLAVPPDQYELDETELGKGLAFADGDISSEGGYQVDWSDLRYAKLLSHQCIYAQYVDNKTGVLVNINSPMIPFLELFDAMMEARQEFAHGTSEVHRRPKRDRFAGPGTPEGIMSVSVGQRRLIDQQVEEWESDMGYTGEYDNNLFDLATELITQDEDAELYEGELEEARAEAHKKDDDICTGNTDEENGDIEAGGGVPDLAEVVEHDEFTAPDTMPERNLLGGFATHLMTGGEGGGDGNMVVNTYVHATLSEYDIYCIFVSMELSEGMFMGTLGAWLADQGDGFIDKPMAAFQTHLDRVFPVIKTLDESSYHDDDESGPPRNTRAKLFADRERFSSSISRLAPDPPMGDLRKLLGFDPSMYYMKQISEEYTDRSSAMIQIVTLLDSVLNGVSGIIDDSYIKHSSPHVHLESGVQSEGSMPKKVEVEWEQLKHIDCLIKEYRRWTEQITKHTTQIHK